MSTTVVQDIPNRLRAKTFLVFAAYAFFAFNSVSCASPAPAPEHSPPPSSATEQRTATGSATERRTPQSPANKRRAARSPVNERRATPVADDDPVGRAFASRASDVQVEGEGRVTRVLPDDLDGRPHQRFILRLASGQTLLVVHNIELAPRIEGLKEGDSVRFNGEYVWNEKGGLIHWTHHDPEGRHVTGWLKHKGKTFK